MPWWETAEMLKKKNVILANSVVLGVISNSLRGN